MKNKKAFTLIELLVVIAIIGIIATVSVLALSEARAKGRDAKRAGDIKQIQTALELFFNDQNRYPTVEEWATGKIFSTTTDATSTYMEFIPTAPTPADGSCVGFQNSLTYTPSVDGSSYTISFCLGNTVGALTPGPKCLTPSGIIDMDCSVQKVVCGQNFIDTRDGQSYPTVAIGSQCWMAKNMNVGEMITSSTSAPCIQTGNGGWSCQQDDSKIEKYCYGDHSEYCNDYGALYEWHEASQLPTSCTVDTVNCDKNPGSVCCNAAISHQGICPTGWHIPSDSEFQSLSNALDGDNYSGGHLKEAGSEHWEKDTSGIDNSSGFTALPAGYYDGAGNYTYLGGSTHFWTTGSFKGVNGNSWEIYASNINSGLSGASREYGHSVRCVADETLACTPSCGDNRCTGGDGCGGLCTISNCGSGYICGVGGTCEDCSAPVAYEGGPYDSSGTNKNQGGYYRVVAIGSQCWLKDNLNVGTMINGNVPLQNNSTIEKHCYNDSLYDCQVNGGLYHWDEAMQYSVVEGVSGICPPGWHIPSEYELHTLEASVANPPGDSNCDPYRGDFGCPGAGTELKVGGSSGFDALLRGSVNSSGYSFNMNNWGYFWSSTKYSEYWAYARFLSSDITVYRTYAQLDNSYSVRCLRN